VHRDASVALDAGDSPRLPTAAIGATESDFLTGHQSDAAQHVGLIRGELGGHGQ
jgi:hypothetical protein